MLEQDQKSFPSILSHCSPYNIPKRLLPTQNSQLLLLLVIVTTKLILHDIAHFYSAVLYSKLIIIILLNEMFLSHPEHSEQLISTSTHLAILAVGMLYTKMGNINFHETVTSYEKALLHLAYHQKLPRCLLTSLTFLSVRS